MKQQVHLFLQIELDIGMRYTSVDYKKEERYRLFHLQ